MKYYGHLSGVKRDELLGGAEEVVSIRNVRVSSDTVLVRGTVLASDSSEGLYAPATSSDVDKVLVIAREDFVADSDNTVTQAYTSGKFNREHLIFGDSSTSVAAFEEPLRKVDIKLTSIKNIFGKTAY